MNLKTISSACLVLAAAASYAGYTLKVVAKNLNHPTGITAGGFGHGRTLFFTEVPTPGVPGSEGGKNAVKALNVRSGNVSTINMGEPEPVNIAFRRGELYWTCKSAGVILQRNRFGMISPLLTGLSKPSGIFVDTNDQVYFTQVPTPGMGGGMNSVDVYTNGSIFNLTRGEPEPTDIVVDNEGTAYWTCKSAGVILKRTRLGTVSLVAKDLKSPTGISLNDRCDRLYWTEVPTPGVSGANGGKNSVKVMDLYSGMTAYVNQGDPQPTDITVTGNGTVYWTCTSAGVIVEAQPH